MRFERQYANLIQNILQMGDYREGRNGGTKALFGKSLTIDMTGNNNFPLLLGRKMHYKGVIGEFAALIRGPHHLDDFKAFDCNYWDLWAQPNGYINVDYGNSWLNFGGVNQLEELKKKLKSNPQDRRMLITGWNPANLDSLDLPCCHLLYQWFVRDNKYLDMIWYQRSVDTMIGLPSDIILAAVWNIMLANECGYEPGKIIMNLGDTHIYEEHFKDAEVYTDRVWTLFENYPTYELLCSPGQETESFVPNMIQIDNYKPMEAIKFELKE